MDKKRREPKRNSVIRKSFNEWCPHIRWKHKAGWLFVGGALDFITTWLKNCQWIYCPICGTINPMVKAKLK